MSFRCVSEYDILEILLWNIICQFHFEPQALKAVLIIIWFLSFNYKVIKIKK